MKWQDAILSMGGVIFLISLLPSLLSDQKPALLTSLSTSITLCAFLAVYANYKLWVAFSLTLLNVILWFALAVQVMAK